MSTTVNEYIKIGMDNKNGSKKAKEYIYFADDICTATKLYS